MLGVEDKTHLEFSSSQNRVLITHDQDFLILQRVMKHTGIVYARQRTPIAKMIQGLILIYETMTEDEMKNHVEYL